MKLDSVCYARGTLHFVVAVTLTSLLVKKTATFPHHTNTSIASTYVRKQQSRQKLYPQGHFDPAQRYNALPLLSPHADADLL